MRFSPTTHVALSELTRYQEWLASNGSIIKGRYGYEVLKKGWGIIGRTKEMSEKELENLATWNSTSDDIEIKTFDALLNNFDLRIKQIEGFNEPQV